MALIRNGGFTVSELDRMSYMEKDLYLLEIQKIHEQLNKRVNK